MTLDQVIAKAARLLDLKDDREAAEHVLRVALDQHAEPSPDRVRAEIFLGELLWKTQPAEARAYLEHAVSTPRPQEWDDLLNDDLLRAHKLLALGR